MKETVGPGRENSHRDTPAVEEVSKSGPTGAVDPGGGDRPSPAILHETASQRGVRNLGRANQEITRFFPIPNLDQSPHSFQFEPRTYLNTIREIRKGAGLDRHRPLPPQHGAGSLRPGSGQLALSGKLLDLSPSRGSKAASRPTTSKGKGCPGDVPDHRRPLKKESAKPPFPRKGVFSEQEIGGLKIRWNRPLCPPCTRTSTRST